MIVELRDPASLDGLVANCAHVASHDCIVGLFSGAWDLFHAFHVQTLKKAKDLCDFLVVGIGTDRLVGADKGLTRPLYPEQHRLLIINSIRYVDACFLMDSEAEYGVMADRIIKPQYNGVMFKPQGWADKLDKIPGYDPDAEYLKSIYEERRQDVEGNRSGNVIIIPDTGPLSKTSTSAFVERIRNLPDEKGRKVT